MGKWAVIYSSVTGNTKKIAEAMAEALGADCDVFRVQEAPEDVSDYDVVLLGYWLRLGAPDPLMLKYLLKVHGTRVCSTMPGPHGGAVSIRLKQQERQPHHARSAQ